MLWLCSTLEIQFWLPVGALWLTGLSILQWLVKWGTTVMCQQWCKKIIIRYFEFNFVFCFPSCHLLSEAWSLSQEHPVRTWMVTVMCLQFAVWWIQKGHYCDSSKNSSLLQVLKKSPSFLLVVVFQIYFSSQTSIIWTRWNWAEWSG